MSRDNAPSRAIDPGIIARAAGSLKSFLGLSAQSGSPETPFFPPGQLIAPVAPGAAGRRFDYPSAINTNIRPRTYEPIDFDTLRAIADPTVGGYDLIRLAIETRKDQMSQLEWSILPRKKSNQKLRAKSDERCEQIETLLRRPDGHTPWQQFCSQLVEEHLVIDAPAIYRRRGMDGSTVRLELMDGALLVPKLNYDGRRPDTGTAYQQIIKGFPAVDYSKDDLLYAPRNPRVNKIYGYSCVEQVLVTVNIGLRRQAGQLAYFTDGNIPDAIQAVPPEWTVSQIKEYQDYWDSMVNDAVTRRKMRFVPAGVAMQQTRQEGALVDAFDEWLARIIAYCFSLPPTPFVKMQNRATAETAYETALSEGLNPLMIWLKGVIDYICANWLDAPDLELIFDDIKKADPAEKEERDIVKMQNGVISIDDMRADAGQEPLGIGPMIRGLGPLGFMSMDSVKKAIANGWDLTGMPQPGLGAGGDIGAAMGGAPGSPVDLSQLGTGGEGDPLAGLPPELLQALGVDSGDAGGAGQSSMVPGPGGATRTAPPPANGVPPGGAASNVVPMHKHPAVQKAMRDGHAAATRMAAKMAGKR